QVAPHDLRLPAIEQNLHPRVGELRLVADVVVNDRIGRIWERLALVEFRGVLHGPLHFLKPVCKTRWEIDDYVGVSTAHPLFLASQRDLRAGELLDLHAFRETGNLEQLLRETLVVQQWWQVLDAVQ